MVIGTHGTLKNLVSKRILQFRHIRILVFDEADEMLKVAHLRPCAPPCFSWNDAVLSFVTGQQLRGCTVPHTAWCQGNQSACGLQLDGFASDSVRMIETLQRDAQQPVQILLFSATFNEKVKRYALKVVQDSGQGEANQVRCFYLCLNIRACALRHGFTDLMDAALGETHVMSLGSCLHVILALDLCASSCFIQHAQCVSGVHPARGPVPGRHQAVSGGENLISEPKPLVTTYFPA